MRVLVTGGNGFIGSALVKRLVAGGAAVRCLVHRSAELLEGLPVEQCPGSITDPASLQKAVEVVELVYHLAGSGKAGDWGSKDWFFQVNAVGTRNLVEAAVRAGTRRLVLASSLAVHRFSGHVDADEHTPANQMRYAYGASKAEAERTVLQAGGQKRLEVSVVRPGVVVLGPEDTTAFIHMAPMLKKGRWTHVAGGKPLTCYSYVDNLVDGILLAGSRAEAVGEIFNITDDLRLSWKELISKLFEAFGVRERPMNFPVWVARLAGPLFEGVYKIVRSKTPPPITDYRTALVSDDFHFSCDKAKRLLGYRPSVPLEEGLRRTVEWYLEWEKRQ